ncbi:hypothetical protein BC943DRAFT_154840 [Umbelopsis sp. AD052]|nr:hypothetical protein BC943DRAFT_154840 [Umbelopsis sp. AD052]
MTQVSPRSRGNGKAAYKEKVVELYEALLRGEEPFKNDPQFWSSLFLLKVKRNFLYALVHDKSEEQLLSVRDSISNIFAQCVEVMNQPTDGVMDILRQTNAIVALTCILRAIFTKSRFTNFSFDVVNLLTRLQNADERFAKLETGIELCLSRDHDPESSPDAVKERCKATIRLLVVLVAGNDNVNQNNLNGYLMKPSLCTAILNVIADLNVDYNEAKVSIMLISLLSNYNKYESKNVVLTQLITTRDAGPLERMVTAIGAGFLDMRADYIEIKDDSESSSTAMLSYFTGLFGWGLSKSESRLQFGSNNDWEKEMDEALAEMPPKQSAMLIAFYELMNANPTFEKLIQKPLVVCYGNESQYTEDIALCAFMSYSSFLLQSPRSKRSVGYSKLVLLIFLRICEDNSLCDLLYSPKLLGNLRLCRQRLPAIPPTDAPRPLACAVLDIMLIFITHNMRKKLEIDLYRNALSIIHRLMSYQVKRKATIFGYHWSHLWQVLLGFVRFLISHYERIATEGDVDELLQLSVTIINMCIVHNDTLLDDDKSYVGLLYEIVRVKPTFEALAQISSPKLGDPARKGSATPPHRGGMDLYNIEHIISHFDDKLELWKTKNKIRTLKPQNVIGNYNLNVWGAYLKTD